MRLRTRLACLGVGLALAASAVVIPTVQDSSAAFTDAEHASVSMEAAELTAPQGQSCDYAALISTTATLHWAPPSPAPANYEYEWQMVSSIGTIEAQGTYPSSTTQHTVGGAVLNLLGTRTFQVRAVSGEWEGPVAEATVTGVQLLTLLVISNCEWQ